MVGPFMTEPARYFRDIFWDSMNVREKSEQKQRGDILDLLITLKNERQDPIFGKKLYTGKIYYN